MGNNKSSIYIMAVVALIVFAKSSFFIVQEGEQGIITQFGKPVGNPITTSGLHFKKPFLQKVIFVDKRILTWDGYPNQIPTKDKKYIKVDTTARWQIVDVLKFIQTVQNERGAKARLDAVLDAATRDVISNHNLVEAVRDSNNILDKIALKKKEISEMKAKGEAVIEEEISGEIEKINVGREQLSAIIVKSSSEELKQFGIKLIDVQLRRISYEKSVEDKVYDRMISEREKIAQKIRSIGLGERAKIEGRLSRDLKEIESSAYRRAQLIRGKAEAKAIKIYADSLSRGKKFYSFKRTLEAYERSLSSKAKFILSSDSDFLKLLKTVN